MPNEYLDKVKLNGTTYDIKDTTSGYITGITINNGSPITNLVTNTAYNYSTNKIATMSDVGAMGGGTVTSVAVSNTGGLTITGSPITSSGTISIGHANSSITSVITPAVYSIAFDSYGHITSYGTSYSEVNLYGVNEWSAGTLPTLGTAVSYTYISSWITNTPTAIDTTKFSGGSFTKGAFSGGSFTRGAFSGGSLSMSGGGSTASEASTLTITFTPATHSADSFTAATHGNDSFTPASLLTGFYTAGSAATLTYSNSTIQPLSSVGTLPTLLTTSYYAVLGRTASLPK